MEHKSLGNLSKQMQAAMFPKPIRNYQLADYQYEVLKETIKDFESSLNENEEIALQLTSFGQSVVMNVVDIGYSNPSLIHFYGFVNGNKSELVQHVSQLNFLITVITKQNPDKPARRIGFTSQECED